MLCDAHRHDQLWFLDWLPLFRGESIPATMRTRSQAHTRFSALCRPLDEAALRRGIDEKGPWSPLDKWEQQIAEEETCERG